MRSKITDLYKNLRISRLYDFVSGRATDAVVNTMTGVGTTRSKSYHTKYVRRDPLTDDEIETLLQDNDLAQRIVGRIVEDALRAGFTLKRRGSDPSQDADRAAAILDGWNALNGHTQLSRGAMWGRGFGGGGLIVAATGSGTLADPLVDEDVEKVVRLIDWDRQDLREAEWYPDGNPSHYWYTPRARGKGPTLGQMRVHESRVLIFPGAETTNRARNDNGGWDNSVLQRVVTALLSFDNMWGSLDDMFADASQRVFKLQGLIESLAEGNGPTSDKDVLTRLALMDVMSSGTRALTLDAGDENGVGAESFDVVERTSLGTLHGVIDKFFVRLAAAARMPLTVLLGMSPAGMDATGESDLILWFNTVDVYRRAALEPHIRRLIRMIARQVGDADPNAWEIAWPELQRATPMDTATMEKMRIDGLVAMITADAATPEEVSLSFRKVMLEGLVGLELDQESRQKALQEALKEVAERAHAEEEDPEGVTPAAKTTKRSVPAKTAGQQK